jgi:hypothetical protein
MCVFDDPTVNPNAMSALTSLQVVASQSGADQFTVWSSGAAHACKPRGAIPPKFVDSNGSDIRLITAGRTAVIAAADLPASTALGNLYILAETEYSVPSLSELSTEGSAAKMTCTSDPGTAAGYYPLTSSSANLVGDYQDLGQGGVWVQDATFGIGGASKGGNVFKDLSPGDWLVWYAMNGTGLDANSSINITDEAVGQGVTIHEVAGASFGSYLQSTTKFSQTRYISVPELVPVGTPMLAFYKSATTTVSASMILIVKISEIVLDSDIAPELSVPGMPTAGNTRDMNRRRSTWVGTTEQGESARLGKAVADLGKRLALLTAEASLDHLVAVPMSGVGSAAGAAARYDSGRTRY